MEPLQLLRIFMGVRWSGCDHRQRGCMQTCHSFFLLGACCCAILSVEARVFGDWRIVKEIPRRNPKRGTNATAKTYPSNLNNLAPHMMSSRSQ